MFFCTVLVCSKFQTNNYFNDKIYLNKSSTIGQGAFCCGTKCRSRIRNLHVPSRVSLSTSDTIMTIERSQISIVWHQTTSNVTYCQKTLCWCHIRVSCFQTLLPRTNTIKSVEPMPIRNTSPPTWKSSYGESSYPLPLQIAPIVQDWKRKWVSELV